MIYYVNAESKRCVTRNNGISVKPISLEYDITEELQFQFLNNNNQIIDISGLSGLSLAIGLHLNKNSYDLLALSNDFTIQDNTLSFTINTYTQNWLKDIQKPNTEAYIEISQQSLNAKKVLLRTYCYVYPRVYVAGLSPQEIDSNDYYTKSEVDELISSIVISGYATEEYVNNAVATKQDIIDADNKLSYALVSGAPTIPTKTSDLTNDSGFITDSALQEYATETYVNSSVSGKADKSEIPTKTSDLQNDSGFITENALSGKQDKITAENKLAYSLISGTPTIPTKTSDLTNDSDFQSASQVQTAISGKQDKITSASKLDYALLSGTPTIPTKTSDLTNDSNFATTTYVQQETSGKLDSPSGGTTGQILKKTATGTEWANESELNPALVQIETKTLGESTAYVVDFIGKQIQKYDTASSASGSIEIQFSNISSIPANTAPTIELQIPVTGDVSTITLPNGVQVIEMPDSLMATSGLFAYHEIVFRAEKDLNDEIVIYANYAYKFEEEEQA